MGPSFVCCLEAKVSADFCSHGEEEYTLAEWNAQRYEKGASPASGVTISDFSTGTGLCQQPAVLNNGNSGGGENSGILACSCNALVMATAYEAGDLCIR